MCGQMIFEKMAQSFVSAKRLLIAFALGLATIFGWLFVGMCSLDAQAVSQNPMATVIYVDTDAAGPSDGLTWPTAFTNVQDALDAAVSGNEIWIAEGVYTPTAGIARAATFQLKNGVALYGGFVATETLRTQRDWEAHVTVLSGDLDGNDITDANGVVTTTNNIVGANAWTVVTSSGADQTLALDGFTITAGDADGGISSGADPSSAGGGMHNSSSTNGLTLTHVTFSGNSADYGGGGMYNRWGNPTLTDVTFSGNSTSMWGGGMRSAYGNPILTGVIFNNNSSGYYGGGMSNLDGSPRLIDVTFSSNTADKYGGGMDDGSSSSQLLNVTFVGNSAGSGGGVYNLSGNPTLTDVTFSGNFAGSSGGGMHNEFSNPTLVNVTFSSNAASTWGGGMNNFDSSPVLTGVIFNGNSSGYYGGGMRNHGGNPRLTDVTFSGNTAGDDGGGMDNSLSNPQLVNVTFSGNFASRNGGGIYNYGEGTTLANCVLWGNTATYGGSQIYNEKSTPTISYSLVQGGCPAGASCTNIIDADPQFVRDPDPGDGDWTTLADNDYGDLSLLPTSPAIDAGDNTAIPSGITTDLGGSPRRFDVPFVVDTGNGTTPIVDMGAYEATWQHQVFVPLVLHASE